MISQRYERQNEEEQRKKQELKKYRQIVTQRKNQQGGIDSFWLFKKDPIKEEKKKARGVQSNGEYIEDSTRM